MGATTTGQRDLSVSRPSQPSHPNPQLPLELIELILFNLWNTPLLTPEERISLMLTLPLVSKTFLITYFRLSSQDVYIPNASYAEKFLHDLVEGSSLLPLLLASSAGSESIKPEYLRNFPDQHCRSITFVSGDTERTRMPWVYSALGTEIDEHPQRYEAPRVSDKAMGEVMSNTLDMISTTLTIPNLRLLNLEMVENIAFDDIFDHFCLVSLPPQITDLCITLTGTAKAPEKRQISSLLELTFRLVQARVSQFKEEQSPNWSLPNLKRLEMRGVGFHGALAMMAVCPALEEAFVRMPPVCADDLELLPRMRMRPKMLGLDIIPTTESAIGPGGTGEVPRRLHCLTVKSKGTSSSVSFETFREDCANIRTTKARSDADNIVVIYT